MVKRLFFFTLIVFLIPFLCCTPTIDTAEIELEQLEQQVQTESRQIEALLTKLATVESEILYPNDIYISPIIPEDWLFAIEESEVTGVVQECVLCIPVPKGIKTGLTVVKSDEGWIYYDRTSYLNPNTNLYVVSSWPKKDRYIFAKGGAKDFRDYPERVDIDYLPSYKVVISPYYIPENVTHGLYQIDGPRSYRDGGNNYDLKRIIAQISDANPYAEKTAIEVQLNTTLLELHEELLMQLETAKDDIYNTLSFVDTLENKYFQPNAWCWNSQDEIAEFRDSMDTTLAGLSQIETSSQEICNWDFSNLEKYRTTAKETM
jgi:hypothetical protein